LTSAYHDERFDMTRLALTRVVALVALLAVLTPAVVDAQGRGGRRPPPAHPGGAVMAGPRIPIVRGRVVFIGGYYYDPFFGPYPWWGPAMYPFPYFPVYDRRAEVRILAQPKTAGVYVDGFYAGIVDDFDGTFQSLPLPPGGHTIVLFLEGHRTARQSLYLRPGSTLKLREALERLPAGVMSEPPVVAPPIPPPPDGSTTAPRTPSATTSTAPAPAEPVDSFGTIELTVQPRTATVTIDGERWVSSDEGRFVVDVPEGRHRIEVFQNGYARFSREVEIRRGETVPLNVSLVRPS
jgi:PEGA domain